MTMMVFVVVAEENVAVDVEVGVVGAEMGGRVKVKGAFG